MDKAIDRFNFVCYAIAKEKVPSYYCRDEKDGFELTIAQTFLNGESTAHIGFLLGNEYFGCYLNEIQIGVEEHYLVIIPRETGWYKVTIPLWILERLI